MECHYLDPISVQHHITWYFRYVNYILITYDSSKTNIDSIIVDLITFTPNYSLHQNLKMTIPLTTWIHQYLEPNMISHFTYNVNLHLQIPIIPYNSCHPIQIKHAAIRFMYNWLRTCNLSKPAESQELHMIHYILYNNTFPIMTNNFYRSTDITVPNTSRQKRVTFTYVDKDAKYVTKLSNNTNLKIAYRTKNSTGVNVRHKTQWQ